MDEIKKTQKGYIKGGYQFFFLEDQINMKFDYHYHSFHKCLIIIEGKVQYEVEGRAYDLGPGDIIWVPSYDAHKVEVSGARSYKRVVVYLSKEFISLLSQQLDQSITSMGRHKSHRIKLSKDQEDHLRSVFNYQKKETISLNNIKGNHKTTTDQRNNKLDEHLSRITEFIQWMNEYFAIVDNLDHVGALDNVKHHKVKEEWIFTSMTYIKEHLNDELRVDDIARQVYLSKYYFMRKFKETLGISIHQYIIQQRLIHARYLMKQGMTLTEISYQSGFRDYSTFARAFKKTYNKSPREFQKLNPTTDFE